VLANDALSLTVGRGEIFGLLGPNGAGKSTLVRQLMGLLRPDSGSILVFGHDVVGDPRVAARAAAYLAQDEPVLEDLTAARAVELTGRLRGLPRPAAHAATGELLDELGLTGIAGRVLTKLSGGQRRLVGVATALVGDRPALVLDEPTPVWTRRRAARCGRPSSAAERQAPRSCSSRTTCSRRRASSIAWQCWTGGG
jgi:ABC-2 type transport system ATP-binding protein